MKLQYLIIIFLLIMAPIYIVFSKYIDTQMDIIKLQNEYNLKLESATYDAVKAFQSNTINSSLYSPETRVKFSKASVNAFFTSLSLAFNFNGETASTMKEYVPAVVFTMYDGYYIYAPFINRLTNVKDESVDNDYKDQKVMSELKPYISYSCIYNIQETGKNYIITYSLDNFIVVDEFDGSNHKRHEGYLMNVNEFENIRGVLDYNNPEKITGFKYNGIEFSANSDGEHLGEYLLEENGNDMKYYYYTIRNGTKYYFSIPDQVPGDLNDNDTESFIFYINDNGERVKQRRNYKDNKESFLDYYNEIKDNHLAFEYYRDAYVFSKWVENNLGEIGTNNIKNSENYDGYSWTEVNKIFDVKGNIEDSDSAFNRHRSDVIRAVIQTNLSAAISGFSTYSNLNGSTDFTMPRISEEDWEILENNVCMATFLQGFTIGNRLYNNYSVVPNTKTKEYIDEDDIYILKTDYTYAKVNENPSNIETKGNLGYYPGLWKIYFETKKIDGILYNPVSYKNASDKINPYLESYSSLIGTELENYSDIYKYIRENGNTALKKAYYIALGRERKGSFKFTNYRE